jgi:hypothetical protein
MNLNKLILGLALTAVPLGASIIISSTDPGLSVLQDFGAPTSTVNKNTNVVTPLTAFTGLTITSSGSGVVYDPNPGTGTCAQQFSPFANCVGTYTVDASNGYASVTSTNLTFKLTNASNTVGFWLFFDPTLAKNTTINVFDSSNGLLESLTLTPAQAGPNFFKVSETGAPISSVQFVGVNATTTIDANGNGYGLVVAHVEVAPEPGTIVMLSMGLGAIGFFARRRKA